MPDKQRLCFISEVPDQGARGFSVRLGGTMTDIFLVRSAEGIYGYVNSCPHTGVNLDWMPDEFMDISGTLIQCATHGALFNVEDGYCCYGPCVGQALRPLQLLLENGEVFLLGERSDGDA